MVFMGKLIFLKNDKFWVCYIKLFLDKYEEMLFNLKYIVLIFVNLNCLNWWGLCDGVKSYLRFYGKS